MNIPEPNEYAKTHGHNPFPPRWEKWLSAARQAILSAQPQAGRYVTTDEHPGKGTVINVADTSARRPRAGAPGPSGECPTLSIVTSGVSIDNTCFAQATCQPGTPTYQLEDMGFNATGSLNFATNLLAWCGAPFTASDCLWEFDIGALRSHIYPFDDCSTGTPTDNDYSATAAVARISGTWYVWIFNPFDGPGNKFNEFFYGAGSGTSPLTIGNIMSGFSGCNTTHLRNGPLMDVYEGDCSSGSGDENMINLGAGGSVILTF